MTKPGPRQRPGSVRIIAGQWRGTRIEVAGADGLRPTTDRVRETLFNWLAPVLPGARCLDLFAGSGVLGFEAVSRGAAHACLVEINAVLAARLRVLKQRLAATAIEIVQTDALAWLGHAPRPHDIVFVDPPFHQALVPRVLRQLAGGWLVAGALVYVEAERESRFDHDGFEIHRQGHTREVSYALVRFTG